MKRFILILIMLILIPIALAKTMEVELKQDESYFLDGRNITLLKIDKSGKSTIICMNNKKEIISDYKFVNGVNIKLKWVKEDRAKFEFRYTTCENCDFGNWDNLDCYNICNNDKDCDDDNDLTLDKCDGRPKKCSNEIIEQKQEENKTSEETKITTASVKEQPEKIQEQKKFKSFTQLLFEAILDFFRKVT